MMMMLLVMILTVAGYWTSPVAANTHTINVALHAQGNYAMHGWVAGGSVLFGRARLFCLEFFLFLQFLCFLLVLLFLRIYESSKRYRL